MKFGMDTRCLPNHVKQCFSFVYNRGHNEVTALPIENQNGKRFVSNKDLVGKVSQFGYFVRNGIKFSSN